MSDYTIYDKNTRKILRTGMSPDPRAGLKENEGVLFYKGDDAKHYINQGDDAIIDKPAGPATLDKDRVQADGVDKATLSGLANPSRVWVRGPIRHRLVVEDGVLSLAFDERGEYRITVDAFPYLRQEFLIVALEP